MPDLTAPVRHSPLAHRAPISDAGGMISLRELPFVGKWVLRANAHEAVERLRSAPGLGLPFDALTSSSSGDTAFLWMGPDEWLLVATAGDISPFRRAAQALAGTHHQLVDVSDYHTVIELEGPKSRELLMKITTLDVQPRAFRVGMVTGTILGRANATLWQVRDDDLQTGPAFRIFVRWSMADYLWCLLADAGREWGVPAQMAVQGEKLTIT